MKFNFFLIASSYILFNLLPVTVVFAVEVAPHISDREIVEKLVTLKIGQDALGKRVEAGQVVSDPAKMKKIGLLKM